MILYNHQHLRLHQQQKNHLLHHQQLPYILLYLILKDFLLGGPNFPSDDPDFGAFEGTTGGVTAIFASLACLQEGGHVVVADTDATELDEDGDARLRDRIALPELCMAPLVLIRIALPLDFFGVWIAASGF